MPLMMLNENHCSAELQAELDFLLSDASIGSALPHHTTFFFFFFHKREACKNARGCLTFLGETCGFPRGPEAPMCCGNGSCSISLSNALLLAGIPWLTQSAAGHKTWESPRGDSQSLKKGRYSCPGQLAGKRQTARRACQEEKLQCAQHSLPVTSPSSQDQPSVIRAGMRPGKQLHGYGGWRRNCRSGNSSQEAGSGR